MSGSSVEWVTRESESLQREVRTSAPLPLRNHSDKGGDDVAVELAGYRLAIEDTQCFIDGRRRAVRAVHCQRVVAVRDSGDSRNDVHFFGSEGIRVAASVQPLMMLAHECSLFGGQLYGRENVEADIRMCLDYLPLLRSQWTRLEENGVSNADLPGVMQIATDLQVLLL
jgi:hypothetical protein